MSGTHDDNLLDKQMNSSYKIQNVKATMQVSSKTSLLSSSPKLTEVSMIKNDNQFD